MDEFLEKLPHFKTAFREFSEFSSYTIYGAVAGIEIDQGVDRYAYQKGLFVIRPSGKTVAIANDHKGSISLMQVSALTLNPSPK